MDSNLKKYLDALCSFREDDFSRMILKPLLEAMGFERVDFNGGAYEKGRDIIAQRRMPPKKGLQVTYVQAKKIGGIQNTSSAAKLSQLIHQLRQCCLGEITNSDGDKIQPTDVILACPEQISSRLMDEINTQLFGMPIKIYPYDGPAIISDIKEYKPELLELLTTIKEKLTSCEEILASNQELLAALKSTSEIDIKDCYSDLQFFVGSFDSNLLLHLDLNVKQKFIDVDKNQWENFKKEMDEFSEKYNLRLIKTTYAEAEHEFRRLKADYEATANTRRKRNLSKLIEKNKLTGERIKQNLDSLYLAITQNTGEAKLSKEKAKERKEILEQLKQGSTAKNFLPIHYECKQKEDIHFYKEAELIQDLIFKKLSIERKTEGLRGRIISEPTYKIELDKEGLVNNLQCRKDRYYQDVDLINKRKSGISKIKSFLLETESTLSLVAALTNKKFPLHDEIRIRKKDVSQDRVSISPHDIFSAGHDIAVYGGAGVGKTTTLLAYANHVSRNTGETIIYVPLNRLIEKFNELTRGGTLKEKPHSNLIVKLILISKGVPPTAENAAEAEAILNEKLAVILDGLDEVYNSIPNIISAISEFKKNHQLAQLIISSRDCVSYLDEIEFLGITLLPFTQIQLDKFIHGWLKDGAKAEKLISTIKTRNLYEHVKTPLLATILCSLVDKGINAPSSENEIYSERLRLLTGEYDLHKKINRQKQTGDLLRKCAIKIAHYMHVQKMRSLSKERMLNSLKAAFQGSHEKSLLSYCIDELINPCNVLIKEPISLEYSFGHFRFQEHLASEELKSNRDIDLTELVVEDWWRGALCLYAQDTNFSHLIEDVYRRYGNIKRARITIEAMIDNRPATQRSGLKGLLKGYEQSDYMDDIVFEQELYDY